MTEVFSPDRPVTSPLVRADARLILRIRAAAALAGLGLPAFGLGIVLLDPPVYGIAIGAGLFAVMAVLVLLRVADHHPHPVFGPANRVTLIRAGLVCALAALVVDPGLLLIPDTRSLAWMPVGLAGVILALDGLDGWLARRSGLASDFGARFDMETDAALILLLSFAAWSLGQTGAWVLGLGLMRYGFVAAGLIWPVLTRPLPPSFRRKAVCVVQVSALIVILMPATGPALAAAIGAIALLALVWSFATDILWLIRARP